MINKKGFTLTELLAVVVIIGVLASMAIPQYRRLLERTKAVEAITNIRDIEASFQRLMLARETLNSITFKDFDMEILGNQATGETYSSDDFTYTLSGNHNEFTVEVERNDPNLTYKLNSISTLGQHTYTITHDCHTKSTAMGHYICGQLQAQNWNYRD